MIHAGFRTDISRKNVFLMSKKIWAQCTSRILDNQYYVRGRCQYSSCHCITNYVTAAMMTSILFCIVYGTTATYYVMHIVLD